MKRKIVIPMKPTIRREGEDRPRERRTLGIKFDRMTGESVSGLR